MFEHTSKLVTGVIILVAMGILTVLCLRACHAGHYWPSDVQRWTREASYYEVKHEGQTLRSVANHLLPEGTGQERWLYAQELAAIRGASATTVMPKGTLLRVGRYRPYNGPARNYYTVGMRSYHLSVMYGMRFGVRPSLLVGIRLHEGGNDCRNSAAWGVEAYRGKGLRVQAREAARIVRRHANRFGWDAWHPTRYWLNRLGGYYTTGHYSATNTHWGGDVAAVMVRAGGRWTQ